MSRELCAMAQPMCLCSAHVCVCVCLGGAVGWGAVCVWTRGAAIVAVSHHCACIACTSPFHFSCRRRKAEAEEEERMKAVFGIRDGGGSDNDSEDYPDDFMSPGIVTKSSISGMCTV